MKISIAFACLLLAACTGPAPSDPPAAATAHPEATRMIPPYKVVLEQGTMMRFVVVSPAVAKTKANLWAVTEDLLTRAPRGAVIAVFFTNEADAPKTVDEFQNAERTKEIANVTINTNTGHRDFHVMNGHRFAD